MTLHYEKKHLPGEKELADKLRPLVEPRRKQYDTKEEQAVCLQELGELYLIAGVESKNGKDFTKAAALFNAALVRTSKEEVQRKIKGQLVVVRQAFMKAFYPDAKLILQEQWEEIRMQNIHTLEKIRTRIKDNSHMLKRLMERYDIDAKNVQEMETCLVNEAKKVTLLVQEEMLEFIKLLWNQSIEFSNGIPPCKYSMMGLGSLARQEMTPYSDLEFAILVREKSDDVQRYFENHTNMFHLSVLDLGETPIPMIAISSLNDFLTPGGDWFYDKITMSGFRLDGEMPWACKTPTGRQASCNKCGLSFIKTPVEMAELLKDDSVLGQSYRVAEVLRRTIHIVGDLDLYDIYQKEVVKISHESAANYFNGQRISAIFDDMIELMSQTKPYHNAKLTYYRVPSTYVEYMRQWLTPCFQGGSQWSVIEHHTKMQKLSEEDAFHLKVVIALAYGVRLFTYFTNKGQRENMETDQLIKDPGMKSIDIKIRIRLKSFIGQTLFANFGEDLPSEMQGFLTTSTCNKPKQYPPLNDMNVNSGFDSISQITELMENFRRKSGENHSLIFPCYYSLYISLAFEDQALHSFRCGDTCHMKKLHLLESEKLNIDNLDFLLKKTHVCACVSLVKTYLKVHRYCTQRVLKLTTDPPDVYLNCIFNELSNCTAGRDVLFLNFNLLKLAYFTTDVTILKRVANSVEKFLFAEVPRLTERMRQKGTFQKMEFKLYWWLKHIYKFLGENEKLTNLLERWINIVETYYPGGDFDLEYIGTYLDLGKVLLQDPEKEEEAIHLYKKALQRLENEVSSNSSMDVYEETLAASVLTCADILLNKKRCEEGEELVKEYFFNDNKSFNFTNDHIIGALQLLAQCYLFSERWVECTEACDKIYRIVKDKGVGGDRSAMDRTAIGKSLILMYRSCGNIADLPKAAECHRIACNTQKDKKLAVLEHKIFLLTSSLHFSGDGFNDMGNHYVLQALSLDPKNFIKKLDFSRPDMLLHILVVLCDALNSFTSSVDLAFLFQNYNVIAISLRSLSELYKTSLTLYHIYVDYRLCHCLFSIAMDPETSFVLKRKETADYLYQTQTHLTKYFPKCAAAIKWCKEARLLLDPNAANFIPQGNIDPSTLVNETQMLVYADRQEDELF